jgi:hypothetical protein
MASHQRHHTVSEGLQRNWCRPGRRIALVEKVGATAKAVGTGNAFLIPKLLTFQTDDGPSNELEVAFADRVENHGAPLIREFVNGDRTPEVEEGVRAMLCLHWARSRSVADAHDRIFAEVAAEHARAAESDEHLGEVFHRARSRAPTPDEMENLILTNAERLRQANTLFARRVQEHYNLALEYFAAKHLERIEIAHGGGVEFAFADSPVVILGGLGHLLGSAARPCPLMQGSLLWFPLSPNVGLTVTERPAGDLSVSPADAQLLNRRSWAYATARLGARLGTDLDLLFARPAGTFSNVSIAETATASSGRAPPALTWSRRHSRG